MDNTPLISIIIPCYNIAQKLPKCLDSIIGQNFSDFEAICVNDASTDDTPQVIERYCDRDNRIRLVSLERNQGLANGRRVGLREARGEFVVFIDGDDWVQKDYLSALIEEQAANDCDVVICGRYKQAFKHAAITRTNISPRLAGRLVKGKELEDIAANFFANSLFPLSMWGKLYRRSLFNLDEIPTIDVFFQEDILLNLYIYRQIKSIKFSNYSGYFYRTGGGSGAVSRRYIDDMKAVYRIKKDYLARGEYHFEDAFNRILIELKNCLYIYFQRKLGSTEPLQAIKDEAARELKDELYKDFDLLSGTYQHFKQDPQFVAVREGDVDTFLSLAKGREGISRVLKNLFKKLLNL